MGGNLEQGKMEESLNDIVINSNTLQLFSLQLYSEAARLGEELVASRIHRINGSKGLPVSTK